MKKDEFTQFVKIPPEIDGIFLTYANEIALIEIAEQYQLSEQDRKIFIQCCQQNKYSKIIIVTFYIDRLTR